ncbi:hypothetical protein KR009_010609 [Drosophila setifemur]|nr:hypothetical protein KR009_010609 [Drosophila setifemur]
MNNENNSRKQAVVEFLRQLKFGGDEVQSPETRDIITLLGLLRELREIDESLEQAGTASTSERQMVECARQLIAQDIERMCAIRELADSNYLQTAYFERRVQQSKDHVLFLQWILNRGDAPASVAQVRPDAGGDDGGVAREAAEAAEAEAAEAEAVDAAAATEATSSTFSTAGEDAGQDAGN